MSTTDRYVRWTVTSSGRVLDYVEAWFDADDARMVRALRPKLVKRCRGIEGNDPDALEMLSARDMIDATASVAFDMSGPLGPWPPNQRASSKTSLGDGSSGSCRITAPPIVGTNSNREPERGCPAQGDKNGRA
jgi:hypothetical protein